MGFQRIRAIVFDLDGTLYHAPPLADAILGAGAGYMSELHGISRETAVLRLKETRTLLRQQGKAPTLSACCCLLGGTVQGLHAYFEAHLEPETFLKRDQRVNDLLQRLSANVTLHLYTNNNRVQTDRIIRHLGFEGVFRSVHVINDTWQAKPDRLSLGRVLQETGADPAEVLFVGDRYDVDLKLPETFGCPVYLSQDIETLLKLEELLSQPEGTAA